MIFIFNPETDYALASKNGVYTPSKGVNLMRRRLSLSFAEVLPANSSLLAYTDKEKDEILIESKWAQLIENKGLKILGPTELHLYCEENVVPWGWNEGLRRFLIRHGISKSILPSIEALSNLKALSHRRTTIPFLKELGKICGTNYEIPREFSNKDEATQYVISHPNSYIKSPWSSSGRGVARCNTVSSDALTARIKSSIDRQGSVMIENAADKILDFATEWMIQEGKAQFLGLSLFYTAPGGEYGHNILDSQNVLHEIIHKHTPHWNLSLIDAQQKALEKIIAPFWTGPAGIDMLVDRNKNIWPCVEINLRHTMGHLALANTGVINLGKDTSPRGGY